MAKFIIVVVLIVFAFIVVGTWMELRKRSADETKLGIGARKARVKELEKKTKTQDAALREIQEIATTSGIATGDPLWEVVAQKVEETLDERKDMR